MASSELLVLTTNVVRMRLPLTGTPSALKVNRALLDLRVSLVLPALLDLRVSLVLPALLDPRVSLVLLVLLAPQVLQVLLAPPWRAVVWSAAMGRSWRAVASP
jgi:hypothetical protein